MSAPTSEEALRDARRAGKLRREGNALLLLAAHGPMRNEKLLNPTAGNVARNAGGFAWITTLHDLERKRLVEKRVGGLFALSDAGAARAEEVRVERIVAHRDALLAIAKDLRPGQRAVMRSFASHLPDGGIYRASDPMDLRVCLAVESRGLIRALGGGGFELTDFGREVAANFVACRTCGRTAVEVEVCCAC